MERIARSAQRISTARCVLHKHHIIIKNGALCNVCSLSVPQSPSPIAFLDPKALAQRSHKSSLPALIYVRDMF